MAIFKFYYTGEVESSRVVSPAYLVDLFISFFFSNFLFHEQTQILPLESLLEALESSTIYFSRSVLSIIFRASLFVRKFKK